MRCLLGGIFTLFLMGGVVLAQDVQPAAEPAAAPAQEAVPAAPAPGAMSAPPAPSNPVPTGPKVLIQTTMGDITLQLDPERAPKSVANILAYVRAKHFDGTAVYRVEKGFVIQMGSFDANSRYRRTRAPIALEANNGLSNLRGTVALARGDGPGEGATAEFFINVKDNQGLDQAKDDKENKTGYAVFGQVISGMDVVDDISNVPVGMNGPMPGSAPVTPIVIRKVSIVPEPKPTAK
jgi:cyclophilin family peptidyl-prolyl cis-trans isomerase